MSSSEPSPSGRGAELGQVVGEHRRVVRVDLGHQRDLLGLVLVVRERVVRVGDADLGVGPRADLAAHHERGHAGEVDLVGQHLQVEHQLDVLGEGGGNALGLGELGQVEVLPLLGPLDAALDVAHALEVLVDLEAVGGPDLVLEVGDLPGHRVENRAVARHAGAADGGVGAAAVAEHLLEHHAGVVLHRQRRRPAAPADGVGVDATVVAAALAGVGPAVDGELQRRELGVPAVLAGQQLVHRDAGHRRGLAGDARRPGQERGRRAGVGRGPVAAEARDHRQLVAERLEGMEDRGDPEPAALLGRRPVLHRDAVGHVDDAEAPGGRGRGPRQGRRGGDHGVQQGQGHRGAQAAQHGPPGQRHLGDHHDVNLLVVV